LRTRKRLKGLQDWLQKNLCAGRMMKAPAPDMDITKILRQEPQVYVAWFPSRPDAAARHNNPAQNVCPSILIMPSTSKMKDMEEKRFDRYNNVHRPKELGQTLAVSILFSVYEPGIRLPGFIDDPRDQTKIIEGTEEGLFTLTDWMDECMEKMQAIKFIPDTDLYLNEASVDYGLYQDQCYVVDKRPIFYGFINAVFNCYADEGKNPGIEDFLK